MGTNHSYSSDFHQKKRVYYTTTPMTTCPTFTSPRPLLPFPSPHFISYPPSAILRCSATPTKPFSRAISWNVASLRMLMRRNPKALQDLVDEYDPDVVCLQVSCIPPFDSIFSDFCTAKLALIDVLFALLL